MNHSTKFPLRRAVGFCGVGVVTAALLSGGCGKNNPEATARKNTALPASTQINAIQSNPAMPDAAKQAAMQSIQQHQAAAAAMRAAASKTK